MAFLGRPSVEDEERAAAWRDWVLLRNPLSIASLVLGIFSLIEFGALVIFGVAGIATGVVALRQLARREPDSASPPFGKRLAWAGIVLSAVSLLIAAVLFTRRRPF
jgi:ABC-type branched-subunit amino acid transport system permease subunit